jgi:hypothetical protein
MQPRDQLTSKEIQVANLRVSGSDQPGNCPPHRNHRAGGEELPPHHLRQTRRLESPRTGSLRCRSRRRRMDHPAGLKSRSANRLDRPGTRFRCERWLKGGSQRASCSGFLRIGLLSSSESAERGALRKDRPSRRVRSGKVILCRVRLDTSGHGLGGCGPSQTNLDFPQES